MSKSNTQSDEDVTIFVDNGVIYCDGGEGSQEYMYMEDIPPNLENHC